MSEEFKPIESQEQLDSIIKSRLERERTAIRSEFADYEQLKSGLAEKTKEAEELSGKITAFEAQIQELNSKLAKSESDSAKTRIAREEGLPFEMVSRLTGANEEEIRKDAKELAKLFKKTTPIFKPDGEKGDSKEAAFKEMLSHMSGN